MSDPETPADAAGPDLRPYDPDRTRFVAGGVLWLAAAILTVVAAYQNIYEIGYGSGASATGNSLDAWGTVHGAAVETSVIHGPAYARVLVVCAVLFALLAVSSLGRAFGLRARRFDGAALAAGIGVTGVLAGLVVALYLYVTSTLDGVRANLAAQLRLGEHVRPDVVTTVGHCAYFALGAFICSAAAAAAAGPRRPRRTD